MKRIPLLALVGLLALPLAGTLQAQQPSNRVQSKMQADSGHRFGPGMRRGMRGGFAARLLAQRAQLRLSDRQVAQLTESQKKYQDRNQALMTQARSTRTDADRQRMQAERKAAREQMQAERQAYLKAHPEVRQSMEQLRQNREAERKDNESVLTSEQKAQLKQQMQQFQRQGGRGWNRDSAQAGRK
jgi:parvulin-like peptidyl-prolyl isomerase